MINVPALSTNTVLIALAYTRTVLNSICASVWIPASQFTSSIERVPDSKITGANMGPIWVRQGPGGPHVWLMNLAICGPFY